MRNLFKPFLVLSLTSLPLQSFAEEIPPNYFTGADLVSPKTSRAVPPVWGKDGKLYVLAGNPVVEGSGPATIFSVNSDGSEVTEFINHISDNYRLDDSSAPLNFVQNSQGVFFGGATSNFDGGSGCPITDSYKDENNNTVTDYYFGALYKASEGELNLVPVSTSKPICPTGQMAIDKDDNIYFLSQVGNAPNEEDIGTKLFKLSADNTALTEIKTFSDENDGKNPVSVLADDSGSETWLYGTHGDLADTESAVQGTLWKIKADGSDYAIIHQFTNASEGKPQESWLIADDNHLYGTTQGEKASIFQVDKDGNNFSSLYAFSGSEVSGMGPITLDGFGNLYGATQGGFGALYRYILDDTDPDVGTYETIHTFDDFFEAVFSMGLMTAKDGKLYGRVAKFDESFNSFDVLYSLDVGYIPPGPIFNSFSASPSEVEWIGSAQSIVTLSWDVSNADTCEASGAWSGSKDLTGSEQVTPAQLGDNVYTLTCDNGSGLEDATSSGSVAVKAVEPPPEVSITSFTASATTLTQGDSTTLSWQVENAVSCSASGNWTGNKDTTGGSETITPGIGSFSYTLSCTGQGGDEQSESVEVSVEANVQDIDSSSGGGGGAVNPLMLLPLALLAALRRRRV